MLGKMALRQMGVRPCLCMAVLLLQWQKSEMMGAIWISWLLRISETVVSNLGSL